MLVDSQTTFETNIHPDGRDHHKSKEILISKPMPKVGDTPPEVVAKDWLNTSTTLTLAGLRGKVVVVGFWATWCGPCIDGIPHLNKLHEQYGNHGLIILSLTKRMPHQKPEHIQVPTVMNDDLTRSVTATL